MKLYILSLFSFLCMLETSAQEKIKVTYQAQSRFETKTQSTNFSDREVAAAVEKAQQEIQEFELILKGDESSFKQIEKIDNSPVESGIVVKFSSFNGIIYKNLANDIFEKTSNLMGKDYVIRDSIPKIEWKISSDEDQILNYKVRKATFTDEKNIIHAWYTPEIPIKNGPEKYGELPGLILKLVIEGINKKNHRYFLANKIEILEDDKPIERPKEKNVVSQKEFTDIFNKNAVDGVITTTTTTVK